jgi:predicted transcriptional regulator of viral defense system
VYLKKAEAIKRLTEYDKRSRYVFTNNDLAKIFHEDSERTLRAGIKRLLDDGLLIRAVNGVYVYSLAQSKGSDTLEQIAKSIRRGEYNYVSLESALADFSVISQIPVDRLTVMTTGRSAEYKTPFGTIEFTHTKRSPMDILENTQQIGRALRLATKQAALRDLKRVGRNTHLVNEEILYEN